MALCLRMIQIFVLLGAASAAVADCVTPKRFTDADLQVLKKSAGESIVYLWSPYMPLSVRGRDEALELGKKLGIATIIPVLDPNRRICHEAAGRFADPVFDSKELAEARALNHFPTLVYLRHGRIVGQIPGYDQPEKFIHHVEELRKRSAP